MGARIHLVLEAELGLQGFGFSLKNANGVRVDVGLLEGRTFQIHVVNRLSQLVLIPVELLPDVRCPILVGGEQCGLDRGHSGKHRWSNGD